MGFDPRAVFQTAFPGNPFRDTQGVALVCHQHLLPSVIPQFQFLIDSGFIPEHILILGKPYSTIWSVAEELAKMGIQILENQATYQRGRYRAGIKNDIQSLWKLVAKLHARKEIERIILLDEGGFLATSVPEHIRPVTTAVEQTTSGSRVFRELVVPTVQIATSAAKRYFESPEIARAIWNRFQAETNLHHKCTIGILGTGFIGSALAKCASEDEYRIFGYDIESSVASRFEMGIALSSVSDLLTQCDVVFGCSGTESVNPSDASGKSVVLISASSGDLEFGRLLRSEDFNSLEGLHSEVGGTGSYSEVRVLNGGYPYNFNGRREFERPEAIILTRMLMIAGIQQALCLDRGKQYNFQLNAEHQRGVVTTWNRITRLLPETDIQPAASWWLRNSL